MPACRWMKQAFFDLLRNATGDGTEAQCSPDHAPFVIRDIEAWFVDQGTGGKFLVFASVHDSSHS